MKSFYAFLLLIVSPVYGAGKVSDERCIPVAKVYGNIICKSEIQMDAEIYKYWLQRQSEKEASAKKIKVEQTRLAKLIWGLSAEGFFSRGIIEVTEDEIDQLVNLLKKKQLVELETSLSQKQFLNELLKKKEYDQPEKGKIEAHILLLENLIRNSERRKKEQVNNNAEKIVWASIMKKWKIDKALFDYYGGRVISQQAGLEPIDAYKQFILDRLDKQEVVIIDNEFSGIYANLLDTAERGHAYLNADQIKDGFAKPFWKNNLESSRAQDFKSFKESYLRLPTRNQKYWIQCDRGYKLNNKAEWFKICQKAIETGSIAALYRVGESYFFGKFTEKNEQEAVKYYWKAARANYPMALVKLGTLYQSGWAVEKDEERAFGLIEKAARMSFPEGMEALAELYEKGVGVRKNLSTSISLRQESALLGENKSQYQLIKYYSKPGASNDDLIQGYAWASVWPSNIRFQKAKDNIGLRLNVNQKQRAEELAKSLIETVKKNKNEMRAKWDDKNFYNLRSK
jgi:TPR repeat protein